MTFPLNHTHHASVKQCRVQIQKTSWRCRWPSCTRWTSCRTATTWRSWCRRRQSIGKKFELFDGLRPEVWRDDSFAFLSFKIAFLFSFKIAFILLLFFIWPNLVSKTHVARVVRVARVAQVVQPTAETPFSGFHLLSFVTASLQLPTYTYVHRSEASCLNTFSWLTSVPTYLHATYILKHPMHETFDS